MKKKQKTGIVLLLAAVLVLGMFFDGSLTGYGEEQKKEPLAAADWMGAIPDNAYINSMNIPGTHDSGMFYAMGTMADCAVTQVMDIGAQLKAGARIFDIRLRYSGNNTCGICHGEGVVFRYDAAIPRALDFLREFSVYSSTNYYTYDIVLKQISDFLKDHPTETVILTVQHEHEATDAAEDQAKDGTLQNFFTAKDDAEETLRKTLSERGKKIIEIKNTERMNVGITMGEARGNVILFEYGTGFGNLMEDSRNRYDRSFANKWDVVQPFLDDADDQKILEQKSPSKFRAIYTSCTGQNTLDENGNRIQNNLGWFDSDSLIIPTPQHEAKYMNRLLLDYPFEKGAYYGWISMDMLTEDLARLIFETNDFEASGVREKRPEMYIKDIKGFCDDDYDDALESCYEEGYYVLTGKKSDGKDFRNVNPDSYPILIGYKLTSNPAEAIREIRGYTDDDDIPSDFIEVKVDNSLTNSFNRGIGWFTDDAYLAYKRTGTKAPITALILTDQTSGREMVKLKDGNEVFNLQEDTSRFYGLDILRSQENRQSGTVFSGGNIYILISGGVILVLAIVIMLMIRKNRKLKQELRKKQEL